SVRRMADRAARSPGHLPNRRQWATCGADPRDGELVAPLGVRGAPPRRLLHGDCPRPDWTRRLGHATWGLLAGCARREHSRLAFGDRCRPGDDRGPLAGWRGGDAVLLPISPAHGAPRPRVERWAWPHREPAASQRKPARSVRAAFAGSPSAGPLRARTVR